ncbi:MAG: hypothetical protein R3F49_21105 [Planctomycetota bacterium]
MTPTTAEIPKETSTWAGRTIVRFPDNRDDLRDDEPEPDTEEPAADAKDDRFDEELADDVPPLRAEGAAHADLARALGDGRQHDVHDADAADEQRDHRDGPQHHVEDLRGLLLLAEQLERDDHLHVVLRPAAEVERARQQERCGQHLVGRAKLHLDLVELDAGALFAPRALAAHFIAEARARRRHRDEDTLVDRDTARARGAPDALQHADHREARRAALHRRAGGVGEREEHVRSGRAEHHHIVEAVAVDLVQPAPVLHREAHHLEVARGRPDDDAARPLRAHAQVLLRLPDRHDVRGAGEHRLDALEVQVRQAVSERLASVALAGRLCQHRLLAPHHDVGRAHRLDLLERLVARALADGEHRNDR